MRRADRLFDIVQRLRGGRLVTASQLAQMLEVSERTIYRDVADLIASGVPIDGEAGVGYIMRSGYDLPPLMFKKAEAEAMIIGLRMAAAFTGERLAEAATEALVKIDAVLPPVLKRQMAETQVFAAGLWLQPQDRVLFDQIQKAIDERVELIFDYRREDGSESQRSIRPLALNFWGRTWTLAAWCLMRQDFRMFRIDRMSSVRSGSRFVMERGKTVADFYRQARDRHSERD